MVESLRPPDGVYTRRSFLRVAATGVVAVTGGGILAACSPAAAPAQSAAGVSPAPSSVGGETSPSVATVGGPLAEFTWAGYDGKGVPAIEDWYSSNNIQLDVKYISNENLVSFFKSPGADKWDLSSVNQGDAEYLFAQEISSEISVEEVPAFNDMLPFFKDGVFWKIADGMYNSVPWTFGPIGINTRADVVPADALKSYEGLFDPKWAQRIGAYDDALNMISVACCAIGKDPAVLSREDLNGSVKDWLIRLKPRLKVLSTSIGDQENVLFSGDVDITLVGLTWFAGDAKKLGTPVNIDFRIPDEGSYGFVDAIFISRTAPHRANAIAWANALTSGETAKAINESVSQLSTVKSVIDTIKPEVRSIYPDDLGAYTSKTLKWNKSWYEADAPYASIEEWRKVWEDVKALG